MSIESVEKALREIRAGRMVILVDDEDRENEGDLCLAAERVTPEAVNFMATHARGLICLTLDEARARQLDLRPMVGNNTSPLSTAFTVSIEAATGVTTGISAADRSHTIQVAIGDGATPADLTRPGHVFPLVARPGGVLVRTGQTEGSVDLARLAGLKPAGVICEIMNADGTMARRPDLERFAAEHDLQNPLGRRPHRLPDAARAAGPRRRRGRPGPGRPGHLPGHRLQGRGAGAGAPGLRAWPVGDRRAGALPGPEPRSHGRPPRRRAPRRGPAHLRPGPGEGRRRGRRGGHLPAHPDGPRRQRPSSSASRPSRRRRRPRPPRSARTSGSSASAPRSSTTSACARCA